MTIKLIKQWFERAVPNPTDKSRAVQLGCHFEEVAEMLESAHRVGHWPTPTKIAPCQTTPRA